MIIWGGLILATKDNEPATVEKKPHGLKGKPSNTIRLSVDERIEAFICGLSELTKRYGLAVRGCWFCGSPFLENLIEGDDNLYVAENLDYSSETGKYEWEKGE